MCYPGYLFIKIGATASASAAGAVLSHPNTIVTRICSPKEKKDRETFKMRDPFASGKASLFGGGVSRLPVQFATRRWHQVSLQHGDQRSSLASTWDEFPRGRRWGLIRRHIWKLVNHGDLGDPVYTSLAQGRRFGSRKACPYRTLEVGLAKKPGCHFAALNFTDLDLTWSWFLSAFPCQGHGGH